MDPPILEPNRETVVALAEKHGIPAIYHFRQYPVAGGLMSYGVSLPVLHHRSAAYGAPLRRDLG